MNELYFKKIMKELGIETYCLTDKGNRVYLFYGTYIEYIEGEGAYVIGYIPEQIENQMFNSNSSLFFVNKRNIIVDEQQTSSLIIRNKNIFIMLLCELINFYDKEKNYDPKQIDDSINNEILNDFIEFSDNNNIEEIMIENGQFETKYTILNELFDRIHAINNNINPYISNQPIRDYDKYNKSLTFEFDATKDSYCNYNSFKMKIYDKRGLGHVVYSNDKNNVINALKFELEENNYISVCSKIGETNKLFIEYPKHKKFQKITIDFDNLTVKINDSIENFESIIDEIWLEIFNILNLAFEYSNSIASKIRKTDSKKLKLQN